MEEKKFNTYAMDTRLFEYLSEKQCCHECWPELSPATPFYSVFTIFILIDRNSTEFSYLQTAHILDTDLKAIGTQTKVALMGPS